MCLKQKHTEINSLRPASLFQRYNMQASPGKIPIGARLTWLLKGYFTLYWPTSFHFLPSSACTHPCLFYFLWQLLSLFTLSNLQKCERKCMSKQKRAGLFSLFFCNICSPSLSFTSTSTQHSKEWEQMLCSYRRCDVSVKHTAMQTKKTWLILDNEALFFC